MTGRTINPWLVLVLVCLAQFMVVLWLIVARGVRPRRAVRPRVPPTLLATGAFGGAALFLAIGAVLLILLLRRRQLDPIVAEPAVV